MAKPLVLAPDQLDLLQEYRNRWREIVLSTRPADREAAEYWLRIWQHCVGLPVPEHIIWVESPVIGAMVVCLLHHLSNSYHGLQSQDPFDRDNLHEVLGKQQTNKIFEATFDPIVDRFYGVLEAGTLRSNLRPNDQRWDRAFELLERDAGFQLDASSRASFVNIQPGREVFRRAWSYTTEATHAYALAEFLDEATPARLPRRVRAILALRRAVGPLWYLGGKYAVLTERPQHTEFDDNQRLHSTTGAAIEYRDGTQFFAIGGVPVPERVVLDPRSISFLDIESEQNAEIRRTMLERCGWENFLIRAGFIEVDSSANGKLYNERRYDPDVRREGLRILRLTNSTPEPDGSYKEYFLRVPPDARTVEDALAWTFGMEAGEYKPIVES